MELITHTFIIENLHCEGCERSINDLLKNMDNRITEVHVSLHDDTVSVVSPKEITSADIARVLDNSGFDVVITDVSEDSKNGSTSNWHSKFGHRFHNWKKSRAHIEKCDLCRDKISHSSNLKKALHYFDSKRSGSIASSTLSGDTTVVIDNSFQASEYKATYSIGDMTCSACTTAITSAVNEHLPSVEIAVDLINKSAAVIVPNKELAIQIQDTINDIGYTCELVELVPLENKSWKVSASVTGMTCMSCVNSIKEQVNQLPFVQEVDISLLTNSATFIVSELKLDELKNTIEDIGYDYELVEVKEISYSIKKRVSRTINLSVNGMFCEHCPDKVNDVLKSYGDTIVVTDKLSLKDPFIKFTYYPSPPDITIRSILEKIKGISDQFEVNIVHPITLEERSAQMAKKEQRKLYIRLLLTFLSAIPTFIIGVVIMDLLPKTSKTHIYFLEPMWAGEVSRSTWALLFLSTPVYFFGADVFHVKAIKEVLSLWRSGVSWKRRLFKFGSMNLLMSLGITIAYFASIALLILSATTKSSKQSMGFSSTYFDSVVFLAFFLLMGRCIDAYSKAQTSSAVSLLGNLRPDTVNIVEQDSKDSEVKNMPIDMVEVGDYVKVLPGERCSVDAIIIDGSSTFDESTLTGESRPVKHVVGDEIFAGTINNGTVAVIAKVKAIEEGSLLNSILSIVREGQLHRAPIERVAEKITGIFVPIVTLIAVLTWIIWLSLGLSGSLPASYLDIDVGGWTVWSLQFAIAVFVVACPCGIGLAAPTALFVGSGIAAKYGILARGGGEAFQEGSNIDIICFDKTGTLTEGGEPKITDYHFVEEESNDILNIASILEGASTHPLGIAVRNFVQNKIGSNYETSSSIRNIEEISGLGLIGDFEKDGVTSNVIIGNERLMEKYDITIANDYHIIMNEWKEQGKSVILLAMSKEGNFEIKLLMAAADKIREESKQVIEALTNRGIDCWMISGDNEVTAKAVAKQVSISEDHVIAGVLPQEKSDKIVRLQKTGNSGKKSGGARAIVAMVGDGVNDAPSLSIADVGIAIGSGSDLALTSAKFVLLKSDLYSLLNLLDISRVVFRRVKFNFAWALVYNLIGVPIAAGVIYPYHNSRLDPVWASLAMALSSISVITSSLLLKMYKPKGK